MQIDNSVRDNNTDFLVNPAESESPQDEVTEQQSVECASMLAETVPSPYDSALSAATTAMDDITVDGQAPQPDIQAVGVTPAAQSQNIFVNTELTRHILSDGYEDFTAYQARFNTWFKRQPIESQMHLAGVKKYIDHQSRIKALTSPKTLSDRQIRELNGTFSANPKHDPLNEKEIAEMAESVLAINIMAGRTDEPKNEADRQKAIAKITETLKGLNESGLDIMLRHAQHQYKTEQGRIKVVRQLIAEDAKMAKVVRNPKLAGFIQDGAKDDPTLNSFKEASKVDATLNNSAANSNGEEFGDRKGVTKDEEKLRSSGEVAKESAEQRNLKEAARGLPDERNNEEATKVLPETQGSSKEAAEGLDAERKRLEEEKRKLQEEKERLQKERAETERQRQEIETRKQEVTAQKVVTEKPIYNELTDQIVGKTVVYATAMKAYEALGKVVTDLEKHPFSGHATIANLKKAVERQGMELSGVWMQQDGQERKFRTDIKGIKYSTFDGRRGMTSQELVQALKDRMGTLDHAIKEGMAQTVSVGKPEIVSKRESEEPQNKRGIKM